MQMVIGGSVRYIFSSLLAELWYSTKGTAIYQKDKTMTPKELYDWRSKMEPKSTTFESNGWVNMGLAMIFPEKIKCQSTTPQNK